MQGRRVQSLIRELRSYMACFQKEKKKGKREIGLTVMYKVDWEGRLQKQAAHVGMRYDPDMG